MRHTKNIIFLIMKDIMTQKKILEFGVFDFKSLEVKEKKDAPEKGHLR
jgi:hypothetical protein